MKHNENILVVDTSTSICKSYEWKEHCIEFTANMFVPTDIIIVAGKRAINAIIQNYTQILEQCFDDGGIESNIHDLLNGTFNEEHLRANNDGFQNTGLSCHLASTMQIFSSSRLFVDALFTELANQYAANVDVPAILDNLSILLQLMNEEHNGMSYRISKHLNMQLLLTQINKDLPPSLRTNKAADPGETIQYIISMLHEFLPNVGAIFQHSVIRTRCCNACEYTSSSNTEQNDMMCIYPDTTSDDVDIDMLQQINNQLGAQQTSDGKCDNPDCVRFQTNHEQIITNDVVKAPAIALFFIKR